MPGNLNFHVKLFEQSGKFHFNLSLVYYFACKWGAVSFSHTAMAGRRTSNTYSHSNSLLHKMYCIINNFSYQQLLLNHISARTSRKKVCKPVILMTCFPELLPESKIRYAVYDVKVEKRTGISTGFDGSAGDFLGLAGEGALTWTSTGLGTSDSSSVFFRETLVSSFLPKHVEHNPPISD
jgi:hypothetical protein